MIRFSARERHQIFVEPTGLDTDEMYLQGFSTSLPEYVQKKMYQSVAGFEHIEIMRSAYAIEYDCINPLCLNHTLGFQDFHGLYAAGQFNGTSGYEEAAAQGLIAGINASAFVRGDEPLTLPRSSSYIGTLIDDLVTKGTDDPYRMMTARSEYRLSLRHATADARLTPIGYQYGLIDESRYRSLQVKLEHIADAVDAVKAASAAPSEALNRYLEENGTAPISQPQKLYALLKRPQVKFDAITKLLGISFDLTAAEAEEVELTVKYDEYIRRQNRQSEQLQSLEHVLLPENLDYRAIHGLSSEAIEKLSRIRPTQLAQASRVSGVSPADISLILTFLKAGGYRG